MDDMVEREWTSEPLDVLTFSWDETKKRRTLNLRGLDFVDFVAPLLEVHLRFRSDREGEVRYVSIVELGPKEYAIVHTRRADDCRIITVRRARPDERRAYRALFGAGGPDAEEPGRHGEG